MASTQVVDAMRLIGPAPDLPAAEFCFVLDVLLAAAIVVVTMQS